MWCHLGRDGGGVVEKAPQPVVTRPVDVVKDEQGQVSQGELKA